MGNKNLFYTFLTIFILLGVCFVSAITTTLVNPTDDSWNLSSEIVFQFTCADSNYSWFNASIYIDGALNDTYGNTSGLFVAGDSNFTLSGFGSATSKYIWNVACCGHYGNTTSGDGECVQSTANFTLGTDTENPSASIDMPKSTTIFAGFPIKISCHASDSFSSLNTIRLTLTKPSGKTIVEYVESGMDRIYRSTETGEAGKYTVDCYVVDVSTRSTDAGQKEFNVYYRSPKSKDVVEPEGEITPEDEGDVIAPPTEGAPAEEKAPSKAWIWIVVIVVIILILYFVLKKKK